MPDKFAVVQFKNADKNGKLIDYVPINYIYHFDKKKIKTDSFSIYWDSKKDNKKPPLKVGAFSRIKDGDTMVDGHFYRVYVLKLLGKLT